MNDVQNKDDFFMRQALAEARKAYDLGEVPIGAVVVVDMFHVERSGCWSWAQFGRNVERSNGTC